MYLGLYGDGGGSEIGVHALVVQGGEVVADMAEKLVGGERTVALPAADDGDLPGDHRLQGDGDQLLAQIGLKDGQGRTAIHCCMPTIFRQNRVMRLL